MANAYVDPNGPAAKTSCPGWVDINWFLQLLNSSNDSFKFYRITQPSPGDPTYVPGPALPYQFKIVLNDGSVQYFKLDCNGYPLEKWDDQAQHWSENGSKLYLSLFTPPGYFLNIPDDFNGLISRPQGIVGLAMSTTDQQALALQLSTSGLFKVRTQYIDYGDTVSGEGTIDFKEQLSPDDYESFKEYLTLMPRQFLWNFFMDKIYPSIPSAGQFADIKEGTPIVDPIYGNTYQFKTYMDMVWAALVDLFNVANLEYVNKNQIDPLAWEQQKTTAYYTAQDQSQIDALQKQFSDYAQVTLLLDPVAKGIMTAYAELPPLGDLGLEINRQNAIKELLKMKEYDSAQAIVDAYRYANDTVIGDQLKKPIPNDIIVSNGTVIAKQSTMVPQT